MSTRSLLCSFVSETFADSSYTSQDRKVTNGLRTHDNSSGVITARGPGLANCQRGNIEVKKLPLIRICSKLAAQLVARPSEQLLVMDCCALVWVGLVNLRKLNAVLPLWSDCPHRRSSTEAEPTMLQATWREQAHRARTPLRLTCSAAA